AVRWVPAFAGNAGLFLLAMSATAAEMPAGASSCSGCHAASAAARTPVPPLAGRPAEATVAALQEFRTGARPATVMDRIAKGFTEEEIAAIAAWYASQKLEPAKKKSDGG